MVAYLPQTDGNPSHSDSPSASPSTSCRPNPNATTGAYSGLLVHLSASVAHRVMWFNPRTGNYSAPTTAASGVVPAGASNWSIPATRPLSTPAGMASDWVLLVEPESQPPPQMVPRTTLRTRRAGRSAEEEAAAAAAAAKEAERNEPREQNTLAPAPAPAPPKPPGTSWVTNVSTTGARVRPEASAIGCTFTSPSVLPDLLTTSSSTMTGSLAVTHLCRGTPPGSRNVETVVLYEAGSGAVVASADTDALHPAFVDALGFVCSGVAGGPVKLTPGLQYALMLEANGCDGWYDDTGVTVAVVGGAAANVSSVYGTPPQLQPGGGGAGHCYGPLNMYLAPTTTTTTTSSKRL